MPLIIITGTPCSGKTFRARQILQAFQNRVEQSQSESHHSVTHLTSRHALSDPSHTDVTPYIPPNQDVNPRDIIYLSARQEKIARAEEFSAVKRALSKNAIIIADGANYIKGFRYQLFCEAKAASTRSVVIHTAAREDESIAWNNARLIAWNWPVEDPEETSDSAKIAQPPGSKIGGNVLGELDPESHTAIYGDKVVNEDTRSRTSSTGAAVSDDDGGQEFGSSRRRHEDTMTLKSLYISDNKQDEPDSRETESLREAREDTDPQTQHGSPPASIPPPPNASLPYSPSTLKSLHMRYEPPSPFTRWDTPLFTIAPTDPHPPYTQIWAALFPIQTKTSSKKSQSTNQQPTTTSAAQASSDVRPHASTMLPTATTPNALQTLESTTNDLTKLILAAARDAEIADGTGGPLSLSIPILSTSNLVEIEKMDVTLEIPEGVVLSQPMLQRARRKYTQIQRGGIAHGQGYTMGRKGVVEGFVRFLQGEWGVDLDE